VCHESPGHFVVLKCMVGDQRCLDDRELEQSIRILTSLQVGSGRYQQQQLWLAKLSC